MKQIELQKKGENNLKRVNIQDAHIQASMLLQYVLNQTKQQLIMNSETEVNIKNEIKYNEYINQIINGTPIQYITHSQQFMGLDFYVDKNVLIPQPDTEILVEEAIKIIEKLNLKLENNNSKILDLCTGSGAIGVSIAHYCKNTKVTATDISSKALEVANKNANNNNVKIKFIKSDLFNKMENELFDIVVSNPPYIETNIIKTLSKQVQAEPHIALDGGEDGLNFYKRILSDVHKYLNKDGYLLLEIGYNQAETVINLPHTNLKLITKQPIKDLGGNDRVVIFQKENNIEE